MKKSVLCISMMLIVFLGGCSNFSKKSTKSGEEVILTYARGADVTQATFKIVEKFNEIHKGEIRVEFKEMPASSDAQREKYIESFAKKKSDIDVFDADVVWPAEFAESGYVIALDKYLERDEIQKEDYLNGPIKAVQFKGKTWGLPKFIDSGLLFYRKDIVEKAPETWEALIGMANAYQGENGTIYGYVAQAKQYEGLICNAIEFIEAYGGAVVDWNGDIIINQSETIKGLTEFINLLNQPSVPSDITSYTEVESHTAFIEGKSVFIRNWPYQWGLANDESKSKIVGKVGVAPLPRGDYGGAATLGGWVTMINKNSKNPGKAWEFMKFMNGEEGQKISAIYAGQAPTLKKLWEDEEVLEANPFFRSKGFKIGLRYAVPRPVSPIYSKLSEIMQIEISKAIKGEITPKKAVENMDREMKRVVEESKK